MKLLEKKVAIVTGAGSGICSSYCFIICRFLFFSGIPYWSIYLPNSNKLINEN